jgi:hypothetical protein
MYIFKNQYCIKIMQFYIFLLCFLFMFFPIYSIGDSNKNDLGLSIIRVLYLFIVILTALFFVYQTITKNQFRYNRLLNALAIMPLCLFFYLAISFSKLKIIGPYVYAYSMYDLIVNNNRKFCIDNTIYNLKACLILRQSTGLRNGIGHKTYDIVSLNIDDNNSSSLDEKYVVQGNAVYGFKFTPIFKNYYLVTFFNEIY